MTLEEKRETLLRTLHEIQGRVMSRTLPIKMDDALSIAETMLADRRNSAEREGRLSSVRMLTPKERIVLSHVANGMTNAQIARTLFVGEQAIKFHLTNIYKKLNVGSRTAAARIALEHEMYVGA